MHTEDLAEATAAVDSIPTHTGRARSASPGTSEVQDTYPGHVQAYTSWQGFWGGIIQVILGVIIEDIPINSLEIINDTANGDITVEHQNTSRLSNTKTGERPETPHLCSSPSPHLCSQIILTANTKVGG